MQLNNGVFGYWVLKYNRAYYLKVTKSLFFDINPVRPNEYNVKNKVAPFHVHQSYLKITNNENSLRFKKSPGEAMGKIEKNIK